MSIDIENRVLSINRRLQAMPWCDFELLRYVAGDELVLSGSVDSSAAHDVEIVFRHVSFISLPVEWKTDTTSPPLLLVEGVDAFKINRKFQVEQGHFLFAFKAEGFPSSFSCLIGAREVEYRDGPEADPSRDELVKSQTRGE